MSDLAARWTTEELGQIIKALNACRILPGSWDKQFVHGMSVLPPDRLSAKQIEQLRRMGTKYRRQLAPLIVDLLKREQMPEEALAARPPRQPDCEQAPLPPSAALAPICPECGNAAIFQRNTKRLYGQDYGPVWICHPCQAWVGCIKGTHRPAGVPATTTLRRDRVNARSIFATLWQTGRMTQQEACEWLAGKLGIPAAECRIGLLTSGQLIRCIEYCREENARTR